MRSQRARFVLKYADDSVIVSLLQGDEKDHGPVLKESVDWRDLFFKLMWLRLKNFQRSTSLLYSSSSVPALSVMKGEPVADVQQYEVFVHCF